MTNWGKMEACGNYSQQSIKLSKLKATQSRKKRSKKKLRDTLRSFQKDLRDRATPAEQAFKQKLKDLKLRYEFQKILKAKGECYIVDFFLTDYHIIIEIDGDYHNKSDQKNKDDIRSRNLTRHNSRVSKIVRFTNNLALAPGNHKTIIKKLFPETNNLALINTEPRSIRSNLIELDKRTG